MKQLWNIPVSFRLKFTIFDLFLFFKRISHKHPRIFVTLDVMNISHTNILHKTIQLFYFFNEISMSNVGLELSLGIFNLTLSQRKLYPIWWSKEDHRLWKTDPSRFWFQYIWHWQNSSNMQKQQKNKKVSVKPSPCPQYENLQLIKSRFSSEEKIKSYGLVCLVSTYTNHIFVAFDNHTRK